MAIDSSATFVTPPIGIEIQVVIMRVLALKRAGLAIISR